MAKAKPQKLTVTSKPDETNGTTLARAMVGTGARHGHLAAVYGQALLGSTRDLPDLTDYAAVLAERQNKAVAGELGFASSMLTAQASSLDAMFTEFARRAALNMGEYIGASERYARLALKAQSNSRAALEALAKLHQPREQTVKHVHVNQGGQAIVADQFHQHRGAEESAQSDGQSHAPAIGGPAGTVTALPSPDPLGNGVPIPSRERAAAMQDARRD